MHYPFKRERKPTTGRHSAGFRFQFHVRSISHRPLFLPLAMKNLPEIQQLFAGVDPKQVFNSYDIHAARQSFNELRKAYDFPFWAVTEYYVRDLYDADLIVPLWLNSFQHKIINIFERRYFQQKLGRYIITKSFGRCGVTTCVQAYILWRQIYHWPKHSYTCCASDININPIKTNLCRFLKRDVVPDDKWIFLPKAFGRHAYFNTYRNPDALRGIDFGYMHFVDMSKWTDPDGRLSQRAYATGWGSVLMMYRSLMVLEGNVPKQNYVNLNDPKYYTLSYELYKLNHLCRNPFFLNEVVNSNITGSSAHLLHIHI